MDEDQPASPPASGRAAHRNTLASASRGVAPSGDAARTKRESSGAKPAATPEHETFLAAGKRGLTFLRQQDGKTVLVKRRNPAAAVDTIANEAKYTKLLNAHGIGPRFLSYDPTTGELVREYIEGVEFRKWLPDAAKAAILPVLLAVLEQSKAMDDAFINKEEMTRPWKHIIIDSKNKASLIDFERCKETSNPKNVSQYCQFLTGTRITGVLRSKNIAIDTKNLLDLAKTYKQNIKSNEKSKNPGIYKQMVAVIKDA